MGISASIAGLPSILTSGCTFFVSIAMLYLGQYLGKTYLAKILGHYAEAISGCILLILGLCEYI
jgi:putative Mn2+ efflux pump MntP